MKSSIPSASASTRVPNQLLAVGAAIIAFCLAGSAFAGSATWSANTINGDWNTQLNWNPLTVPNGSSDVATFETSNTTSVSISTYTEVYNIVFNAGGNAFTIATTSSSSLTISGGGIINNSGITQTFVTGPNGTLTDEIDFFNAASAGSSTLFLNSGTLRFLDNSSAGSGTFVNKAASNYAPGQMQFRTNSNAANGAFVCKGGTVNGSYGGFIGFMENSAAGTGTFTLEGAAIAGAAGGEVQFNGGSADNATFTVNGGTALNAEGGSVRFASEGSAANATLTANGGANGGKGGGIYLWGLGGTCRVKVYDNGFLDASLQYAGPVVIGSLEGNGNVFMGVFGLTVGSNNLSTVFSGALRDGNSTGTGDGGGLFIKIGNGTLALSGASLYTGGTRVDGGGLMANNSAGSATGSGPVTVNSSATLGGAGMISGSVTVNAGAILSPGDINSSSGALRLAGNLTLAGASVLEFGLGNSGAHSSLSRNGGNWAFASNQTVALRGNVQPGFYDNVITGLAADPGGTSAWVISNQGVTGNFSYDGNGNIDLTISAAPTPSPTPTATPTATATPTTSPGFVGNIATRLQVGANDDALIEGFIVQGPPGASKKIVVRAEGPELYKCCGIPGFLANPTLEIHDSQSTIATNDDWKVTQIGGVIASDQSEEIRSSGFAPVNDPEPAVIVNLAPGSYTAVVRGMGNSTGLGTVEAYDLSNSSPSRLANIATRGLVQPGDKLMIGSFIMQNAPVKVVVRAIGPSLSAFGITNALTDTTLELRDGSGAIVVQNDDWKIRSDGSSQQAELEATGLQPTHELEAALVTTLPPGQYSALLRGKPETTGIGVVQVYFLQ